MEKWPELAVPRFAASALIGEERGCDQPAGVATIALRIGGSDWPLRS